MTYKLIVYSLFMCQDKKRKRNRERKFSFVLDNACDEQTKPLVLHYIEVLVLLEQTKALVLFFIFVFVLVDEQAITQKLQLSRFCMFIPNCIVGYFFLPLVLCHLEMC